MPQSVKVTIDNLEVKKDGDPSGKGELYWYFRVDSTEIETRTVSNPRKVSSGENIAIRKSATVNKNPGETLVIYCSVSDKDGGFDGADETSSFNLRFTEGDNWGAGAFDRDISDGPLEVTVYGRIDLV